MMLLEFDFYQEPETDLSRYDAGILGHAGKFSGAVEQYLGEYFEWREVRQIQVALDTEIIDDYYIANHLNGLPGLFDEAEKAEIQKELKAGAASEEFHPRVKATSEAYDTVSYAQASMINHGKTLHNMLMEPLVRRVTNLPSEALLARYHRMFWAPLYYPETLLANFTGEASLSPARFHHPIGVPISRLSKMLYAELADGCVLVNELISLKRQGENWLVNDELKSNQVGCSLPQSMLAKLLGLDSAPLNRSSYLLVFLKVEGEIDCEVLFNASNVSSLFRLVNQSRLRGEKESTNCLCVEYNLDLAESVDQKFVDNQRYLEDIRVFIEHFELGEFRVVDSSVIELRERIVFPEIDNIRLATENSRKLEGQRLWLMGPSIGMIGSSLNDQVIQAQRLVQTSV